MRRWIVTVVALLTAAVASAQTNNTIKPFRLTLFASDLGVRDSTLGSRVTGAAGLGLAYAHDERWSTELAVSVHRHTAPYTVFRNLAGVMVPYTAARELDTYPIELTTRYDLVNRSRWTPFLLAGVRHVVAPEYGSPITSVTLPLDAVVVTESFRVDDRTSAEAGAGVVLGLTERLGLQVEGRRLLRSDDAPYDPLTRFGVGVTWKF